MKTKKYITNKLFNNFQSYRKVLVCDETRGTDIAGFIIRKRKNIKITKKCNIC